MNFLKVFLIFFVLVFYLNADDDDHHFPRDLSSLDLTKEQKKEFKKLLREYHKVRERHEDDEDDFEDFMEDEFEKSSFTTEVFKSKKIELYKNAIEIEGEILGKIHSILTPRQRRDFADYLEEWEID